MSEHSSHKNREAPSIDVEMLEFNEDAVNNFCRVASNNHDQLDSEENQEESTGTDFMEKLNSES